MSLFKTCIGLSFLSLIVSCSGEYKNERTVGESFSYSFQGAECQTGSQSFSSKQAMCLALLDERRNKSCAKDLRHEKYNKGCIEFGAIDSFTKTTDKSSVDSNQESFPGIANPTEDSAEVLEKKRPLKIFS